MVKEKPETAADDPHTRGQLVDVVDEAKSFQFEGDRLRQAGFVKAIAPAKVNLYLAVGKRRADGFHAAESLMHALSLHDVLYVGRLDAEEAAKARSEAALPGAALPGATALPGAAPSCEKPPSGKAPSPDACLVGEAGNIVLRVRTVARGGTDPLGVPAAENIVAKAIDLLARAVGKRDGDALAVYVEKGIPAQGGLGGGSADAAAALLATARLWSVPADDPLVGEVARQVGSDVAFFLRGGCGLYDGAGDAFVRSLAPQRGNVVLVKPAGGVSTAAAYARFDEAPYFVGEATRTAMQVAQRAQDVPLFNNLAAASEHLMPELAEVRTWLAAQPGVGGVLLCGSGATTFAACESFDAACELVGAARLRGWWARATTFSPIRAAVL